MNKRQAKKKRLGYKMGKCSLRRRIKNVKLLEKPTTMFDDLGISDAFCPYCGCETVEMTDNLVGYPELWQIGYCARCGRKVIEADNSPYIHILREMLEEN